MINKKIKIGLVIFLAVAALFFLQNNITGGVVASYTPTIVDIADGEKFTITAEEIVKQINGQEVMMYAYNGVVPGVALRVQQSSTIKVNFVNRLKEETTIHWHGLRHDVKNDGVPGISQEPVKPGKNFEYTLYFPDSGIYWYHPHVREDRQQDLGLAGNMLVIPTSPDYFNSVDLEELVVLDDILIEDGVMVPFGKEYANFALMGRFGNTMLLNGQTDYSLEVAQGEIIRFYLTNVANVRPFNLSFDGAKMKLVGGDLGKFEEEEFVDSIIIAPAERYIVEVFFSEKREYNIENRNPSGVTSLGKIKVNGLTKTQHFKQFLNLKENIKIKEDIEKFRPLFDKPVDYQIDLTVDMGGIMNVMAALPCHSMGGLVMGNCTVEERAQFEGEAEHDESTIEWEDGMVDMSKQFTTNDLTWILRDPITGKENMDLGMEAEVGDIMKIRFFNDPKSMHPMQHPLHLHGQRFLVTEIDGMPSKNLVWKDTVLVPIGSTVDVLVDVTNFGEWMMHCHIAEHLEAGMMTSLIVTEA
ncbi:multicopper oxidase family protein [Candidatus Woesearchaeota archaeon]|jgi:suppressor of ftsI|nr:multicopper oxidase family protein [Candidatus Woesearchaeota archaeon]